MSRRFRCPSCRTAFVSHDEQAGRPVVCPKCGAGLTKPPEAATEPAPVPEAPAGSVFVPADAAGTTRRGRKVKVAAALLALLAVSAVAVVVAWPKLREWWHPVPPDPIETVATAYLKALKDGDTEAARRLGTVDLPPAIRSFRTVHHDKARDTRLRGSFGPVAAFHAGVDKAYTYDPSSGRFTPRNLMGPAAETLDALHEAAEKAEKDKVYEKMRSGNPEDLFDAAEALAKPYAALAKGALAPRKLIPSYKQLVEDARPPLPPSERSLALDFGENRETWDQLLKRPYLTLKADGPFVLDRAEVTADVVDALGSLGDPPTPLRLTLTRFRLELIDTGWRVTSARRETNPTPPAATAPEPSTSTPPPTESPGARPY